MKYTINARWEVYNGFKVIAKDVHEAADLTNNLLHDLPASLYRSLDYKTVSAVIGSIYCEALAREVKAMVNPIEKGHPDIIPSSAEGASEARLRNYGTGLEVKCTVGNIVTGANLRAGHRRINALVGITWQAHHREVDQLMGLIWDFAQEAKSFLYPAITGVFYTNQLTREDWGEISGTLGRNTKVSGMKASGKQKMGSGWIILADEPQYVRCYKRLLSSVRKD